METSKHMAKASEPISNGDSIIDSRDILARVKFLQKLERAAINGFKTIQAACIADGGNLEEDPDGTWTADDGTMYADTEEWTEDEYTELRALQEVVKDADLDHDYRRGGCALINDDHFVEYCRQFAQDIGDISRDSSVAAYVDWDAYAESVKMDYKQVDFSDAQYWIRS